MFRKEWLRLVVLALVIALLLGQILPASAQDAADTANAAPADTEIITEVPVMEGAEGAPLALPGLEATVQEAVPVEADAVQTLGTQSRVFLPTVFTQSSVETGNEVSAAYAYWETIKDETFETGELGGLPSGWSRNDCGTYNNGGEYWGRVVFGNGGNGWSAWAAGGPAGQKDPNSAGNDGDYTGNECDMMIYGPFKLSQALTAKMTFKYWNRSELNHDYFRWLAYCTGKRGWNGPPGISGNSGGWQTGTLDLGNIPGIGSCLGTSADVWIAFRFTSDLLIDNKGAFVDDVKIEQYLQYNP